MTFYFAMTNSWSLLYDEIYGDEPMTDDKIDIITGVGNTASTVTTDYNVDLDSFENISINTGECPEGITNVPLSSNIDDNISIKTNLPESTDDPWIYESPDKGVTVTRRKSNSLDKEVIQGDYFGDGYPPAQNFLADNDDQAAHHFAVGSVGDFTMSEGVESVTIKIPEEFQTPGIQSKNTRKYNEDKSIEALQEYVSSTYGGHYTSKENNVQTLDLIESVGDAESFCRSNAIKYLSRYDKKGQAKRDILKALHYSLLLYHFSGQLNETPTRGYETF